jgi:hypothetical protein
MRLILALAVTLLTACATTVAQNKTIPISVIGEGTTINDAKNNGFQKAIEQEVGVVLLSQKQIKNDKLSKDEIVLHSAGYIDHYTVLDTEKVNNTYYLTMDVYVKSSSIAERVLGVSNKSKSVNGEKIHDQFEVYSKYRKTGDELMKAVLEEYPHSAFIVKNQRIDSSGVVIAIDKNRNPVFIVPFEVSYNYNFLKSFNEALKATSDKEIKGHVQQRKIRVISKKPGSVWGSTDSYFINDIQRDELIKQHFVGKLYVKLIALDGAGKRLFHTCQTFAGEEDTIYLNKEFTINGNDVFENELAFTFKKNHPIMKEVSSYVLTVHKGKC